MNPTVITVVILTHSSMSSVVVRDLVSSIDLLQYFLLLLVVLLILRKEFSAFVHVDGIHIFLVVAGLVDASDVWQA